MRRVPAPALSLLLALTVGPGCATTTTTTTPAAPATAATTTTSPPSSTTTATRAPLPPSPEPRPPAPEERTVFHPPTLLVGGRVLTAAGVTFERGHVLLVDGKIAALGPGDGAASPGAVIVDVSGRTITPGLIDTHSHMGVYATPSTEANSDGNEIGSPRTPEVQAEHGFWPQDASLVRALQEGVTTIQVLPGSATLIGEHRPPADSQPATSGCHDRASAELARRN